MKHGCVYEGVAQSGHVKILLPTGERYTCSASPSDRNSVQVAQKDIAKKLGIRIEKPRSGRYKRGIRRESHVAAVERVDSVSSQYDRLAERHRALCAQINYAQAQGDRTRCKPAVRELFDIEAAITELGRRPPLRTFRA
jgi:hypothetical protein